jgi:hypothetical protein
MKELKPFLVTVTDYHEFDDVVAHFKCAGIKLKFVEVGCNCKYHAIFYPVGKIKQAESLIKYWKNKLEDE